MAQKNSPVGRIMYREGKGEPWLQIGTLWTSPFEGTFGLSLGNRAFKDNPEVTPEEAAEYLTAASTGRGFTNVWMNRPKSERRGRGDGDDFGDDTF
jgi:hypothetical protein